MNAASKTSFWFWPGWAQLAYAVALGLAQAVLFCAVYGGANWWTAQHDQRIAVHTDLDLALPLAPWMAVFYVSLTPLLWLAPFVLRTRAELRAIVLAQAVATLIAGVGFILLPAEAVFPTATQQELGSWSGVFHLAKWMALQHNYLPSLHVAFTVICTGAYSVRARRFGKLLLAIWGTAIVTSTLLIHQHYLLDVVTGALLGAAALYWVYRPWSQERAAEAVETARTNPSKDRALRA